MSRQWLLAAALACLLSCGPKRVPQRPAPPPPAPAPAPKQNLVVLLEDDGKTGRIVVSNAQGSQELSQPSQAVRVESAANAPGAPFIMEAGEVRRLFGGALDAVPPPEVRFTLYLDTGGAQLTRESTAQIPVILRVIQERRSADVSITGHTDTTGEAKSNYELGLKRARQVLEILKPAGLREEHVTVTSDGETNLAVKTPDGVNEPKNRRVEVIVR